MYRFNLCGTEVSCDSVEELLAVIPRSDVHPTTKTTRARKAASESTGSASESWRVAKLYGEKKGMGIKEARTFLAAHPTAKSRFVNSLAKA